MEDRYGWFIFGMCMFFVTAGMILVNYNYFNSLSGFNQMRYGIPAVLGLFCGAWMIAHSLFKSEDLRTKKW